MALADLAPYAYSKYPVYLKVTLGAIDVTRYVAGVSGLSKSLDYPNLTEYRQGEGTVTFHDPDGYFSDKNPNNFYAANSLPTDGAGVDVRIDTGYIVDGTVISETLFVGKITKIGQDAQEGLTDILVSDQLNVIFSQDVEDIGVERNFQLSLSEQRSGIHAEYEIPAFLAPIADGSVTVKKDINTELTEVDNLNAVGAFDSDRYKVDDNAIVVEGDAITGAATGYPQITMKSAFRNAEIEDLIASVLTALGITNTSIYLPDSDAAADFSSDGRIGNDLVNTTATGSASLAGWYRFVTDMVVESDAYYILWSTPRDEDTQPSYLLKYDRTAKTTSILYRTTAPSPTFEGTELWKLAKDGDNIAILAADSQFQNAIGSVPDLVTRTPVPKSYDASRSDSQTYLLLFDLTSDTATTLVAKTATLAPQLAHYYIMGETQPVTTGEGFRRSGMFSMFPDTRRRLEWHSDELYYVYFNKTNDRYGVAKVNISGTATSVFEINSDGSNYAGIHFIKKGSKLWVLNTRKDGGSSKVTVFDEDI